MADERIDIEVTDRVNASIAVKIRAIGDNANQAASNLDKLNAALAQLDSRKVDALTTAQGKYSSQLAKDAIAQERVNQGYLKTEESLNRAIIAENKAAQSAAGLAASNAKAEAAQRLSARAAEKLIQAQNDTAVSAGKVTAQNNLTAVSQQKLQQSQITTATTAARLQTANNNSAVSLSRVAQQNNLTAASGVKLQTSNNQLAISSTNVTKAQSALQGQLARTTASQNAAITSAVKLQQAQLRLQQAQSKQSGGGSGSALAGAGLGYLAVEETKAIISEVSAYQSLENRIRTVLSAGQDLHVVQQRLVDVANATYAPLDAVVVLYQRLKVSGDRYGVTGEQLYQVITNIGKAFALSGATAEETRGAIIQLSQAVGGNFKTSAQELNTVLEQAPGVAKVLAQQLGTTTDQLKRLAKEGSIDTKTFFKAFEDGGKGIDELKARFASIIPTISNAMTRFQTNLTNVTGAIGETSGASGFLAQSIIFLSDHLEVVGFAAGAIFPVLVAGFVSSKLAAFAFNEVVLSNPLILGAALFAGAITALAVLAQKSDAAAQVFKDLDAAATNFVYTVVTGFAKVLSGTDRVIDGWHELKNIMGDKTIYLPSTLGPDMQKYADKIAEAAAKGKGLGETLIDATKNALGLADSGEEVDDWFKKVRTDGAAAGEASANGFKKATYEINRATVALQEYDRQLPGGAKIITVPNQLGGVDSRDISGVYGNGTSSNGPGIGGSGGTTSYAFGGAVHGRGGPRDDLIPAMLSNGEFVVNAEATSKHRALLNAINTSPIRRYADGGLVDESTLQQAQSLRDNYNQASYAYSDESQKLYALQDELKQAYIMHDDSAVQRIQQEIAAVQEELSQLSQAVNDAANAMRKFADRSINDYEKHTYQLGGGDLDSIEASGFDPYVGLNGSPGGYAFSGHYSQEIIDSFNRQQQAIQQWNKLLDSWWTSTKDTLLPGDQNKVGQMVKLWESGDHKFISDPRQWLAGGPIGIHKNPNYNTLPYKFEDVRALISRNGYLTSVLASSPVWGDTVGKYVQYSGPQYGGIVQYGGENSGPVSYAIPKAPSPYSGNIDPGDLSKFFGKFATGGSFVVGGDGGPDSQLVQFMASPDERVTVQTPQQQQRSGATINVPINMTIQGADPRTWKASEGQVVASLARKVAEELRNQGVLN